MAFESLASAIFRQEGSLRADGGWNTASTGYRNNNPGNLVYAGQPGAIPLPSRDPNMAGAGNNVTYARFDTLENGILATERQLALDAGRGLTLGQRLSSWATANRAAYVANVSSWLGVSPDTPLSELDTGSPGNFRKVRPRSPASGPQLKGKPPKSK
jgi:hypothetical protein